MSEGPAPPGSAAPAPSGPVPAAPAAPGPRRRAAFLDRDGTLHRDVDFLRRPEDLDLIPGAADAVRRLRAAGYLAIVVTNQSGIARGYLDEAMLARIHERLQALLVEAAGEEARIDAFYHCPHLGPGCSCRKPLPGLLERAAREHGVALAESVAMGDRERDVEAGLAAGCRDAYLLAPSRPPSTRATAVAPSLAEAVSRLLAGRA